MQNVKRMDHRTRLQERIAALAARRMVENGEPAGPAMRKSAVELLGDGARVRGALPDEEQVGAAVREHQRCFGGQEHADWLRAQRQLALEWMERLERFEPRLTGALLDASATLESPVQLDLYADSAKDVEMALLERGVDYRVEPPGRRRLHVQEVIGFVADDPRPVPAAGPGRLRGTPVLLTIYDPVAARAASARHRGPDDPRLHPIERAGRADAAMLRRLLEETGAIARQRQDAGANTDRG